MYDLSTASIQRIAIHKVGNKCHSEGTVLSEQPLRLLSVEEEELLMGYLLRSFQSAEENTFAHPEGVAANFSFSSLGHVFANADQFQEASKDLASFLHDNLNHPSIKGGEFLMVQFDGVVYDEMAVDAIGLFKLEKKTPFLELTPGADEFDARFQEATALTKLDKGAIIFNVHEEEGFRVLIHDAISKGDEARYWKDEFLGIEPISTEFQMTTEYMNMCKSFVMERVPEDFEVDRTVQMEILNRSSGYFKESEEIDTKQFAEQVLEEPQLVESFTQYQQEYQDKNHVEFDDQFAASKKAVKSGSKFFKSVLKLDKNFHIYVHGNPNNIESGYDEERGMKFYKVFYNEEK